MSKYRNHKSRKPLKNSDMNNPYYCQQVTDEMIKRLNKDLGISKTSSTETTKKDR